MPKGLKILDLKGTLLYNISWNVGVDHNEELFNDADYNENYDEARNTFWNKISNRINKIKDKNDNNLHKEDYHAVDVNEIDYLANDITYDNNKNIDKVVEGRKVTEEIDKIPKPVDDKEDNYDAAIIDINKELRTTETKIVKDDSK